MAKPLMLTPTEIEHGYWGDRWLKLPQPIREVKEYQGEDTLWVSCTQLIGTATYKQRVVSEWCEALPHLGAVKRLCFGTRVSQKLFDAASLMPNLEALYVKWGGIKSVASIVGSTKLRVLTLGSNPGIQDVQQLRNLSQLYVLQLENVRGASNLAFLAQLENLEALGIDGSMWTTQKVESLEPLEHLQKLKYLSLLNTRVCSGGLTPLLNIKSLVHIKTALWYTVEEFASLRMGLPLLKYGTPLDEDRINQYAKP